MDSKPLISVVITGHGKGNEVDEHPELRLILQSLANQREYAPGIGGTGNGVLYIAGPRINNLDLEVIVTWDGLFRYEQQLDGEFGFKVVHNEKQGGIGHHTRGPGIEAATGEWIVLTNSDNYFMQGWYSSLVRTIETGNDQLGAIYWNGISNLWKWSDWGGGDRNIHRGSRLNRGYIDLSFFAVRVEVAKEVGFPFREYDGDFSYIDLCVVEATKRGYSVKHIPETLSVHN